jgi:hypothetical protein
MWIYLVFSGFPYKAALSPASNRDPLFSCWSLFSSKTLTLTKIMGIYYYYYYYVASLQMSNPRTLAFNFQSVLVRSNGVLIMQFAVEKSEEDLRKYKTQIMFYTRPKLTGGNNTAFSCLSLLLLKQ